MLDNCVRVLLDRVSLAVVAGSLSFYVSLSSQRAELLPPVKSELNVSSSSR